MPPQTTCPDTPTLEHLLLGQLSAAEREPLEEHLLHCERCAAAAKTLHAEDRLVEAMRAARTAADPDDTRDEVLGGLMSRLREVGPPSVVEAAQYQFLAPPQAPDELGRLGPYRILKVLGAGGMGVVFQAEDPQLRRLVALKAMLPALAVSASARGRFLREAQATAAINHDHIVHIYQVGEDRGVPFLAMQLLQGEPLNARLQREARLPLAEVLRIGREVAEGLAAAHAGKLIHRDIKPANIWLETRGQESGDRSQELEVRSQGSGARHQRSRPVSDPCPLTPDSWFRVKVLDFGLARAIGDTSQITQSGAIVGTPAYMAPEQGRGERVDSRCDLFSLGCVLYQLCTGQLPFKGIDTVSTLMAVANEHPKSPHDLNPAVPPALSDLVMRLLAKAPDERLSSASALVDALRAIEQNLAVESPTEAQGIAAASPPTTQQETQAEGRSLAPLRPPSRMSRRLLLWGAGAAALATLIVVLSWGEIFNENQGEPSGVSRRRPPPLAEHNPPALEKNVQPAKPPATDDRTAAEWVLKIGGKVGIALGEGEQVVTIVPPEGLPNKPFRLVTIHLLDNKQVTDQGLEQLRGLQGLRKLNLAATAITNRGLEHLQGLTSLSELHVMTTAISGAGLIHLKGLANLETLDLANTRISDKDLQHLHAFPKLDRLGLQATQITDAGFAWLGKLGNLKTLNLNYTAATGAGLEHLAASGKLTGLNLAGSKCTVEGLAVLNRFPNLDYLRLNLQPLTDAHMRQVAGLSNLRGLDLTNTPTTDAMLEHLQGLAKLKQLDLVDVKITDKGLEHLKALSQLNYLRLQGTQVTEAGIESFKAAVPRCKVFRSEPPSKLLGSADRAAAEWALSIGGNVGIDFGEGNQVVNIIPPEGLPEKPFRLVSIHLLENKQVTDQGLEQLRGLKGLQTLNLAATPITNKGMEHLQGLTGLTRLDVKSTAISGAGLAHLKGFVNLESLDLTNTRIVDNDLQNLHAFPKLYRLELQGTKITDAGLEVLGGLGNLKSLNLGYTAVTGAGFEHLVRLRNLAALHFNGTKCTAMDLAVLKRFPALVHLSLTHQPLSDAHLRQLKELPNLRRLDLMYTPITDAGLEHLATLSKLAYLDLFAMKITDEGLKHLHGLSQLRYVRLKETRVTQAGIDALQAALPQCKVER